MKKTDKIFNGTLLFFGLNAVFLIIGCAYGNPLAGLISGGGILLLGFCVIYPLVKLTE